MAKKSREYAVLELSDRCWNEVDQLAERLDKGAQETMEALLEKWAEASARERNKGAKCD